MADSKQSQEHQLIHLVWRRSPRNQRNCATDGQKTTISDSTQTELKTRDHSKFSEKPFTSNMDFTSDSYKTPAKRQSSKPITLKTTKYQIGTSNRFEWLKNEDILDESGRLSPPPSPRIFFGKKRHSQLPTETLSLNSENDHKTTPDKILPNIPTPSGSSDGDFRPLLPSTRGPVVPSSPSQCNKIGTVYTCHFESMRLRGLHGYPPFRGCIKTVDHKTIPFRSMEEFITGSQVTYELEYSSGEQRATHVSPYQDAFSPGHLL